MVNCTWLVMLLNQFRKAYCLSSPCSHITNILWRNQNKTWPLQTHVRNGMSCSNYDNPYYIGGRFDLRQTNRIFRLIIYPQLSKTNHWLTTFWYVSKRDARCDLVYICYRFFEITRIFLNAGLFDLNYLRSLIAKFLDCQGKIPWYRIKIHKKNLDFSWMFITL